MSAGGPGRAQEVTQTSEWLGQPQYPGLGPFGELALLYCSGFHNIFGPS